MRRVWMYLGFTFIFTWGVEYAMIGAGGLTSRWASALLLLIMALPALGNAATRIFSREGFSDMHLRPSKHDRRTLLVFGAAWLLPIAATVLGAVLYFLIQPSLLDLHMDHFTGIYKDIYSEMGREYSDAQIRQALRTQVVLAMTLSPCLNLVSSLGCELGFRGYLLPKLMEKHKAPTAVILTGLIWGLWYGPLIEMGQFYGTDYAGYPFLGMAAAIVLCVVLGTFLSWLMLRTGSCAASAVALATFNGFYAVSVYFCANEDYSPFLGPVPTGIVGGIGFIALAVYSMYKLRDMKL